MIFDAKTQHEKAGVVIFQNESHYYYLCKSVNELDPVIQLFRSEGDTIALMVEENLATKTDPIILKIDAQGSTYDFRYQEGFGEMKTLKKDVDAKFLSTETGGGFVGCIYALYATSNGEESQNSARFEWCEYNNQDEISR
jgi:alpha-N-arabinofuranosidase